MKILAASIFLALATTIKLNDIKHLMNGHKKKEIKSYFHFLRSSVLFIIAIHFGLQALVPELPSWSSLVIFPVLLVAYDSEYRGIMISAIPPDS